MLTSEEREELKDIIDLIAFDTSLMRMDSREKRLYRKAVNILRLVQKGVEHDH